MLMRSDMLGLPELPAAMRRGQGRSALSKFMRFQVSADTSAPKARENPFQNAKIRALRERAQALEAKYDLRPGPHADPAQFQPPAEVNLRMEDAGLRFFCACALESQVSLKVS
jgi:hypothetical protein